MPLDVTVSKTDEQRHHALASVTHPALSGACTTTDLVSAVLFSISVSLQGDWPKSKGCSGIPVHQRRRHVELIISSVFYSCYTMDTVSKLLQQGAPPHPPPPTPELAAFYNSTADDRNA